LLTEKFMSRFLTPAALVLILAAPIQAQAHLTIGDAAPALKVEKWLKGAPIQTFEKGQVYVVEFWATWCGPCRASIPHLTELQARHRNEALHVLGVNIWEKYKEDTLEKVQAFVAEQGAKMDYTVAYDGPSAAMATSFMQAAGEKGIPTAFIVDRQGKVVFIGYPLAMDKVLDQVLAGTWTVEMGKADLAKSQEESRKAAEQAKAMAPLNEFAASFKNKEYDKAYATGHAIMASKLKDMPQVMNIIAWAIVDPANRPEKQDLDLALQAATRACELSSFKDATFLDTLARVQFSMGRKAEAIETQKKVLALPSEAEDKAEMEAALKEYEAAAK
jgi:thiol-disulfide isomerase/thioredoxin